MEHIQRPSLDRRNTVFGLEASDSAQLKSELVLMQRKYERLEQKEKRLQVTGRERKRESVCVRERE